MDINCNCNKKARKVLIGLRFVFYNCEDESCNYEVPLCHCSKVSKLIISENKTRYFTCAEKSCKFIIASCSCNKICSIKISKTDNNPGLFFWSCKGYPRDSCNTFVSIPGALKKYFPNEDYYEFVGNLWKYMPLILKYVQY